MATSESLSWVSRLNVSITLICNHAKSIYQQTFEKDSSFTLLRAINVEKATNAALDEQMSLE
jgi:hypothetical protein